VEGNLTCPQLALGRVTGTLVDVTGGR